MLFRLVSAPPIRPFGWCCLDVVDFVQFTKLLYLRGRATCSGLRFARRSETGPRAGWLLRGIVRVFSDNVVSTPYRRNYDVSYTVPGRSCTFCSSWCSCRPRSRPAAARGGCKRAFPVSYLTAQSPYAVLLCSLGNSVKQQLRPLRSLAPSTLSTLSTFSLSSPFGNETPAKTQNDVPSQLTQRPPPPELSFPSYRFEQQIVLFSNAHQHTSMHCDTH